MTSEYSKQTTDQLLALIKRLSADVEKNIVEMAHVLTELRKRGYSHEFMKAGLLRWYVELAAGTLTPKAVITFAGVGTVLRKMTGLLPPDLQDRLASGEKIAVATHDAEGKVVTEERTILQLTTRQLDLVFDGKGAMRSIASQKKILSARKPEKDVRRSKVAVVIRADIETGELVCGQMRFKPSELVGPLRELGMQLTRIPKKAAA